eukprot:5751308-Prymnesium_polylepis.3
MESMRIIFDSDPELPKDSGQRVQTVCLKVGSKVPRRRLAQAHAGSRSERTHSSDNARCQQAAHATPRATCAAEASATPAHCPCSSPCFRRRWRCWYSTRRCTPTSSETSSTTATVSRRRSCASMI